MTEAHDHGLCERTGKHRYTRRQALAQARWWQRSRLARMRSYRCKHCGSWHIGNDGQRRRKRVA